MAKLDAKGQITGTAGPVYYRTFNGTTFVQTKPGKGNVKQATATKNSASDFGKASSLAKAIRNALFPVLQNHSDNAFYRRFTAQVHAAAQAGNPNPKGSRSLLDGDVGLLENIDCNINSPFAHYCALTPTITLSDTHTLEIHLPECNVSEQIARIPQASHAALAFLVTAVNPQTNQQTHAELFRVDFELTNTLIPAQQWVANALPEGQLVVVAAALFYYRNDRLAGMVGLNGKGLHPCGVMGVFR